MFALVDCNSFYASCEQIFRPDLRGKPVVVLSNNDGCIVARSAQAKTLGIPDLQPFFKIESLLRHHNVAVFSSNYALYADISERVMTTLHRFSPDVEVYSIDELFLGLTGMDCDLKALGAEIKQTLWQQVKMPVSVGIAPTKTLAKLANHAAKKIDKTQGVCLLDSPDKWQWLLKRVPVQSVWGVGRRLTKRLQHFDIHTASDLANANRKVIRAMSNVNLERTIAELNGISCLELESVRPAKKQIYCTRSFGKKATTAATLKQALALYASRASEKMRAQQHLATTLHVFINTSPHKPNYHAASTAIALPYPTDDTRVIVGAVCASVDKLFREGHAYLKAGVGIIEMQDRNHRQGDLFHAGQSPKTDVLMNAFDAINQKYGKGSLFVASQGNQPNRSWYMRQQNRSPQYTTQWADIPIIRC